MKKIAIIEDDQLFHEALQRALKKAGYQVAGAFSLAQGYEVLKEHPSLLIIDRNLPDGDGLELCRKARESGGIPALFLTARFFSAFRILYRICRPHGRSTKRIFFSGFFRWAKAEYSGKYHAFNTTKRYHNR